MGFAGLTQRLQYLVQPTNSGKWSFLTLNYLSRRNEPVIAIGGGVTLDTAGLACNLYRRNTPIIKVRLPTVQLVWDFFVSFVASATSFHTAVVVDGPVVHCQQSWPIDDRLGSFLKRLVKPGCAYAQPWVMLCCYVLSMFGYRNFLKVLYIWPCEPLELGL